MKKILILALFCSQALANSQFVVKEFEKRHPKPTCPITALLGCSDYVIGQRVPFCVGGEDKVYNLRWEERNYSLLRDGQEKELCANTKKAVDACRVIKSKDLNLLDMCK